jgi:methylthioribose-1-phosphate isomerase
MSSLIAIKYRHGSLELLDQRLLPFEQKWLDVPDAETAWHHIKDMVVRGAPAIGVTGALSLAVELINKKHGGKDFADVPSAVAFVEERLTYLVSSRPTAVNLADAADKLRVIAARGAAANGTQSHSHNIRCPHNP